jgi:membrane-bound inhibitor of C-type lysozyme
MIVQGQTTSFKKELYEAIHNFTTDTFKIALYTANATLNQDTIAYTATGEISGAGYTATGQTLLDPVVSSASGVAYISFDNISWTSASFTVRGALIYNSSKANRSVAVLDFGSDKVTTSTFTITFPANTATSAIIRSSN